MVISSPWNICGGTSRTTNVGPQRRASTRRRRTAKSLRSRSGGEPRSVGDRSSTGLIATVCSFAEYRPHHASRCAPHLARPAGASSMGTRRSRRQVVTVMPCVSRHRLAPRRRPELRHHALGEEPQALHGLLVPVRGRIMEQERGQSGLVAERVELGDHRLGRAVHERRGGEGVVVQGVDAAASPRRCRDTPRSPNS